MVVPPLIRWPGPITFETISTVILRFLKDSLTFLIIEELTTILEYKAVFWVQFISFYLK